MEGIYMKKILSLLLATVIAAGMSVSAFAADDAATVQTSPFKDVDTKTEQGTAILKMYERGYLAGYEDGTFRPNGYVTRAELVRIINQTFGFKLNEELNTADFSDNNKNAWYYADVRTAQQMGYISGFGDNTFRPADNFTRQQACVVLTLLTNAPAAEKPVTVSDEVSPWADKYVKDAIASGLFRLEANNTFRATMNITRGELCVALAGFVKEEQTSEQQTQQTVSSESTETTTVKSSSSSSGGGGGGGGRSSGSSNKEIGTETTTAAKTPSSSSSNTGTTTSANKETSTEATTQKAPEKTTEAPTELTTSDTVDVDPTLLSSVNRTSRIIKKYVIPNCTTDLQRNVAEDIASAMDSFYSDQSFDVQSAANGAMDKYHSMSQEEKDAFKNLVASYCSATDLIKLRDTFFPGLSA